jgi:putative Mg2+ transporter-C (MgtC) family protein
MSIMTLIQTVGAFVGGVVGYVDGVFLGRLVLTLVLCGVVGLERASHDRAAGFRPHILVGIGACLMTLAGGYGFGDLASAGRDPLRVASYVVSGIGFLGAGAILRHGATIRGITTAASLWTVAGIGIAVGAGLGGLAAVTVGLVLFTLGPLQRLESRLRLGNRTNDLTIYVQNDRPAVGKTLAALDRLGVPVQRTTILPGAGTSAVLRVELGRALTAEQAPLLVRRLLTLKYVERVETTSSHLDPEDSRPTDEGVVRSGAGADMPQLNLHDDALLRDLLESDGAVSVPPPRSTA